MASEGSRGQNKLSSLFVCSLLVQLASAHTKTLELAKQHGVAAIGFSLLSAGIFRGGKELRDVLKISCTSVKEAVYPGLQAQQCDLPNLKLDTGCNIGGSYDRLHR